MGEDENEDDDEKMKNRENRLTYASPFHTCLCCLNELGEQFGERRYVVADLVISPWTSVTALSHCMNAISISPHRC